MRRNVCRGRANRNDCLGNSALEEPCQRHRRNVHRDLVIHCIHRPQGDWLLVNDQVIVALKLFENADSQNCFWILPLADPLGDGGSVLFDVMEVVGFMCKRKLMQPN